MPFSLLEEHGRAARDENVLRANADAINALIGGLDFDVEDEQVATEIVLGRQLERNAFDSALKSAERARLGNVPELCLVALPVQQGVDGGRTAA